MSSKLSPLVAAALATVAALASVSARADTPGRHASYVHALTDLRDARWNIQHRAGGDATVGRQEQLALREIEYAIRDARQAAADDGKNIAEPVHEDANLDQAGRLHHALDLLRKAQDDVGQEEDDRRAREVQHRLQQHVAAAVRATETAIRDVETHR